MGNTYIQFVFSFQGWANLIKEDFGDELEKVRCGVVSNQTGKTYAIYCNPDHTHLFAGMHQNFRFILLSEFFEINHPANFPFALPAAFPENL